MNNKKAAIELSMTTIVVVVLSLTLLIMGFVLVRSIMCGAITSTEQINSKVRAQIDDLFSSSGGDVVCLGAGDEVTLLAGEPNNIWCSVKAESTKEYKFHIEINEGFSTISKDTIKGWIASMEDETKPISPNDREPKKIYKLNIPKTAEEGDMAFDMEISVKDGSSYTSVWSGTLSYKVEQPGAIKGFMC